MDMKTYNVYTRMYVHVCTCAQCKTHVVPKEVHVHINHSGSISTSFTHLCTPHSDEGVVVSSRCLPTVDHYTSEMIEGADRRLRPVSWHLMICVIRNRYHLTYMNKARTSTTNGLDTRICCGLRGCKHSHKSFVDMYMYMYIL